MPLFDSATLKQRSRRKTFSDTQLLKFKKDQPKDSFDIFLSHSYLDKEEVEGIYFFLTDLGFSVYVDWIVDPQLDRSNVTKETAELVRKRMAASKSLLMAISANAAISKWMPWELGFVDAKTSRCAIIPVEQNGYGSTTFRRYEYLLLYPYLKLAMIENTQKAYVIETGNTYVSFDSWLKSKSTPTYNFKNIDHL